MNNFAQKCSEFNKYVERALKSSLYGFQTENKIDRDYNELELLLIKETWQEAYGREPNEQEIEQQKIELVKMKYLVESWMDEYYKKAALENRLKTEKRGFHLEVDGKRCQICSKPMKAEDSWFDRNGLKCMTCKNAITKKVIPASVNRSRKNWFTEEEFRHLCEVDRRTTKKLIETGRLKPRDIMSQDGKTLWFRLFLGRENMEVVYECVVKAFSRELSQNKEPNKAEKEKIEKQVDAYLDKKMPDLRK